MNDLLSRSVVSGPTCGGIQAPQRALGASGGATADAPTSSSSAAGYPEQSRSADEAQVFVSGIKGTVTTAGKNEDGKSLTIALQVENTTEKDLRIALIGPEPAAIDNEGTQYALESFSGAGQCQQLHASYMDKCLTEWIKMNHYSMLQPGAKTTLVFGFESRSTSTGHVVSFSSTFALLHVAPPGDGNKEEQFALSTIGLGVPNIKVAEKG